MKYINEQINKLMKEMKQLNEERERRECYLSWGNTCC